MHEIALVEKLVSVLERETASAEIGEVKTVYLELGKLRYIAPQVLTTCFRYMPKPEKLRKAKLDITVLPVKIKCLDCGGENIVEEFASCCKSCHSGNVRVVSGDEFNLKGIEW